MKANKFQFASRLASLVLAPVFITTIAACGGDDDSNDIGGKTGGTTSLSDKTTPIDFQFKERAYNSFFALYDYAADGAYVGSDTTKYSKCSVNLRQGSHRLLWMEGVDGNEYLNWEWGQTGYGDKYYMGLHYDPETGLVTDYDYDKSDGYNHTVGHDVVYSEQLIDVTPYLMPAQEVVFDKTVCAKIKVNITGSMPTEHLYHQGKLNDYSYYSDIVGIITGTPCVKAVALTSDDYQLTNKMFSGSMYAEVYSGPDAPNGYDIKSLTGYVTVLCPLNGMDNVKMSFFIRKADGDILTTVNLPQCSIRRGYTTILTGPLTSSASDWNVTMEPYNP